MAVLLAAEELVQSRHGRCSLQHMWVHPMGKAHVGHLGRWDPFAREAEEDLHHTSTRRRHASDVVLSRVAFLDYEDMTELWSEGLSYAHIACTMHDKLAYVAILLLRHMRKQILKQNFVLFVDLCRVCQG